MSYDRIAAIGILASLVATGSACSSSDDPEPPWANSTATGTGTDTDTGTGTDTGTDTDTATGTGELGSAEQAPTGSTAAQYMTINVRRNGVPYALITNGWGSGWESHQIAWQGTSFTVISTEGTAGSNGQPASYPSVFCGNYSEQATGCGLPVRIDEVQSLRTGWRWDPNGNDGEYNAAYDIWVGDGQGLQGYLMVWLRDPPLNRPAGAIDSGNTGITIKNVPGTWDIWRGTVNGRPIINWVATTETHEIEFDIMDFVRDADARGLTYPGTHINAVAVGFEIWEGPISNLQSLDFYVDVQ